MICMELDPHNISGTIFTQYCGYFVYNNDKIFKGVSTYITYIIYIKILLVAATIVTRHTDCIHPTSLTSGRSKSLYCE